MLYRFLLSNKGITMVEILIVVIILGILTGIAVPIMGNVVTIQRRKDCINQKTVIKGHIDEAIFGMIDNGKRQPKIYFQKVQSDHRTTYPGDGVTGNGDDAYVDKDCFVLIEDQDLPGKIAFTLGDLRGGYGINNGNVRNSNGEIITDYTEACDYGCYLKKKKLENLKFYTLLANQEIPVCPFADLDDTDTSNDYYYYILWDETEEQSLILCSCPECNEVD